MRIILGIILGGCAAFALNHFFGNKVENKSRRLGLTISAWFVCIGFGLSFFYINSLRSGLDSFITGRIVSIEGAVNEIFPGSNLFNREIDTGNYTEISGELQQALNSAGKTGSNLWETLIYTAFLGIISSYFNAFTTSMDTVLIAAGTDNNITIGTVLYNLKNVTLNSISPFLIIGQVGTFILFLAYIGFYIGIVFYWKKNPQKKGNKNISFGDSA